MCFSDAEEEKLINVVGEHPVIYDTSHADYRNVFAKENIWKTTGKELNKSSDDCKKKWKFIRDGYQRFKKKNKLGTGSAAPKNSKDKRHQQLLFLDNVSQHRAGCSNIPATPQETTQNVENNPENDEEQEEQILRSDQSELQNDNENTKMQTDDEIIEVINNKENIIPKEPNNQKPKEKRQRRSNNEDKLIKLWKERDEKRQTLLKTIAKRQDDDIEFFSRHIAEVLRRLPPVYKAEAKKHLSVVLSNYEIMTARNGSTTGPISTESSDINISSRRSSSSLSQYPSYDVNASFTSPSSQSASESPGPSNTSQHTNITYTPGPVHYMLNAFAPMSSVSPELTDSTFQAPSENLEYHNM